jgi:hypothetical protein
MFAASGWMATVISYLAVFGQSDNVIQSYLAQSLPLAFVGLVVSYVIGPIADDWLQLRWNRAGA